MVSLMVSGFPAASSSQSIIGVFIGNGQNITCDEIKVVSSTEGSTSLMMITPEFDLGREPRITALVTVSPRADPSRFVSFNYTFFAVAPQLVLFTPSAGKNDGSDLIWVKIQYFRPQSKQVAVHVSGILAASQVSLMNNQKITLIAFTVPKGIDAGMKTIEIYPSTCNQSCSSLVSFLFPVLCASQPQLVLPVPSSASFQQLSTSGRFPDFQIQNVDPSYMSCNYITGRIEARNLGNFHARCLEVTTHNNDTFAVSIQFPHEVFSAEDNLNITLLIVDKTSSHNISFAFELFDGRMMRLAAVYPFSVPITRSIRGRPIRFEPTSTFVFNVPFEINFSLMHFYIINGPDLVLAEAMGTTVLPISSCAMNGGQGCARVAISLLLPSLAEPGTKGLYVNSTNNSWTFDGAVEYTIGCDYDTFCASGLIDYRALIASPTIVCEASICLDPSRIPLPVVVSVIPTRGSTSGGTKVSVVLTNFQGFSTEEVIITSKSGLLQGTATVLSVDVVGTAKSNSVFITFTTPPDGRRYGGNQILSISSIGDIKVSVPILFRYILPVSGSPFITLCSPSDALLNFPFNINLRLTNVQELENMGSGYNVSSLAIFLEDPEGGMRRSDASVIYSNAIETSVLLSSIQCDMVGVWKVQVQSTDQIDYPASTATVLVQSIPPPILKNWFPTSCTSLAPFQKMSVDISYLPLDVKNIMVYIRKSGELRTEVNGTVAKQVSSMCSSSACSVFRIQFLVPFDSLAFTDQSRAEMGNSVQVEWYDSNGSLYSIIDPLPFTCNAELPFLASIFPVSHVIGSIPKSSMKIINMLCNDLFVLFNYPVNMSAKVDKCVEINQNTIMVDFVPPIFAFAGTVHATVSDRRSTLSFPYYYKAPAILIEPGDGPLDGGYLVSALLSGIKEVDIKGLNVTLVDQVIGISTRLAVESIQSITSSSTLAKIRLPPLSSETGHDVLIQVLSAEADFIAVGTFTYFKQPTIKSLSPQWATTDGATTAADGVSVTIEVAGIPPLQSPSELSVSFISSTQMLECDGFSCGLIEFQNLVSSIIFKIQVPPFPYGSCNIKLTYVPQLPFQERSVSTAFNFLTPPPVLRSALYCRYCPTCYSSGGCRQCIQGGICVSDQTAPMKSQMTISSKECDEGISCRGVIQIRVDNVPEVKFKNSNGKVDQESTILSAFGAEQILYGSVRRIVSQSERTLTIEIEPPLIPSPKALDILLSIYPKNSQIAVTIPIPIICLDENVIVTCGKGGCQGPNSASFTFNASVSNLLIPKGLRIEDQITVLINNQPGLIVSSHVGETTSLTILPPPLINEQSIIGYSTVSFSVLWASTLTLIGATQYTYWVPPRIVSASFSPYAESIIILFDSNATIGEQDWNLNGVCGEALSQVEYLGRNSGCTWSGYQQFVISLGFGATIVPGSTLQLLNVMSLNKISRKTNPVATVQVPKAPISPSLTVKAPAIIDPCSSLELTAISSSPRPVVAIWTCLNDVSLNSELNTMSGSTLMLLQGTPSMQYLDKNYTISVRITDFMGFQSNLVIFSVFKKSMPVPIVTFSPTHLRINRNQAAEVAAQAAFSSCSLSKSKIGFTWRQISGPTKIPIDYFKSSAQLRIPPNTLLAGSTYVLGLNAAMSDDPSQFSESQFPIQVGVQQLLARVTGGGDLWVGAGFTLDASGSLDLDLDPSAPQGLRYGWRCLFQSENEPESPCMSADGQLLTFSSSPNISFPAWTFSPSNKSYRFTVTVAKAGRLPASFSLDVYIRTIAVPQAKSSADVDSSAYQADGSLLINGNDRLNVHGTCVSSATNASQVYTMKWSFEPPLQPEWTLSNTLFPLGLQSSSLVIVSSSSSSVLLPGLKYKISLDCENEEGVGRVGLVIQVNKPPTGGSCTACLSGGVNCVREGFALIDAFRVECMGWADPNLPLQYRFGFRSLMDSADATWFAYSQEHFIDLMLPSGTFEVLAMVRDSLDAETQEFKTTLVSNGMANVRRRVANGNDLGNFNDAISEIIVGTIGLIQDLALAGSASKMNLAVAALGFELDGISEKRKFDQYRLEQWREAILMNFVEAEGLAGSSSTYACEALCAIRLVIASRNLSTASIRIIAPLVYRLLDDTAVSIDTDCAGCAISVISSAMGARSINDNLSNISTASTLLSWLRPTMSLVFRKAASRLLPGERLSFADITSVVEFRRLYLPQLPLYFSCSRLSEHDICKRYRVNVTLPNNISNELHHTEGNIFDVILNIYDRPPSEELLAPLVVFWMSKPGGGDSAVSLQTRANPIRIIFPSDQSSSYECVYWDEKHTAYSTEGLITANEAGVIQNPDVICYANHLGAFTLRPASPVIESSSMILPGTTARYDQAEALPELMLPSNTPDQLILPSTTTITTSGWTATATMVSGLEAFGPVMVLMPTVSLGFPSAKIVSTYSLPNPFSMMQIVVPAGAWPISAASGSARSELTATVLALPHNLSGLPGESCGPVISIGPYGLDLSAPIFVAVPCLSQRRDGFISAVYQYDPVGKVWNQGQSEGLDVIRISYGGNSSDVSQPTWARVDRLGPLATFLISEKPKVKGDYFSSAIIVGSVAGFLSFTALLMIGIWAYFRWRIQKAGDDLDETWVSQGISSPGKAFVDDPVFDFKAFEQDELDQEVTGALVFESDFPSAYKALSNDVSGSDVTVSNESLSLVEDFDSSETTDLSSNRELQITGSEEISGELVFESNISSRGSTRIIFPAAAAGARQLQALTPSMSRVQMPSATPVMGASGTLQSSLPDITVDLVYGDKFVAPVPAGSEESGLGGGIMLTSKQLKCDSSNSGDPLLLSTSPPAGFSTASIQASCKVGSDCVWSELMHDGKILKRPETNILFDAKAEFSERSTKMVSEDFESSKSDGREVPGYPEEGDGSGMQTGQDSDAAASKIGFCSEPLRPEAACKECMPMESIYATNQSRLGADLPSFFAAPAPMEPEAAVSAGIMSNEDDVRRPASLGLGRVDTSLNESTSSDSAVDHGVMSSSDVCENPLAMTGVSQDRNKAALARAAKMLQQMLQLQEQAEHCEAQDGLRSEHENLVHVVCDVASAPVSPLVLSTPTGVCDSRTAPDTSGWQDIDTPSRQIVVHRRHESLSQAGTAASSSAWDVSATERRDAVSRPVAVADDLIQLALRRDSPRWDLSGASTGIIPFGLIAETGQEDGACSMERRMTGLGQAAAQSDAVGVLPSPFEPEESRHTALHTYMLRMRNASHAGWLAGSPRHSPRHSPVRRGFGECAVPGSPLRRRGGGDGASSPLQRGGEVGAAGQRDPAMGTTSSRSPEDGEGSGSGGSAPSSPLSLRRRPKGQKDL
jgi:hypothetical protein